MRHTSLHASRLFKTNQFRFSSWWKLMGNLSPHLCTYVPSIHLYMRPFSTSLHASLPFKTNQFRFSSWWGILPLISVHVSLPYISTCVPSVHLYMRPFHAKLASSGSQVEAVIFLARRQTDTKLRKRTGGNKFFKMVSFAPYTGFLLPHRPRGSFR